ncbi:N-acetyltransferase B complex non catalytic subunit-domain-containing protein [Annulohypoxylon maeteangense]|uniref:N-acetyltransferase B complex non catalytic subunit-domain-containing protein n=1 Tax=Annulohypoxylon maeteangense TaxID=1927788 RepID=UPI002007B861|nr:N-acetyltransferase B complex non catalytic subunit-domain-containing protein [Annulohypoxylon maeteangense]KAI0890763.1 N-acetyltransferase B complex non catalytic subunit-domain-containing protein [Annulohypoxylon maeteangense]
MRPPLPKPSARPINIKQSAPINLQSSFAEEQWIITANLARQRYRATKDPYYLAVEVAAKSQSDNVADRSAGKAAVEKMIKDNVVVTDVDALDLYEFACSHVDIKYPETIGVLRIRLVKASPKDQKACTRCFDACVWNSDWKNAQQIAASLNKTFAADRKLLFRYIMTTHLYSLSRECPEASRKIFASLAKAQADKAFDLRTDIYGLEGLHRANLAEPEEWVWLEIRIAHCSSKENLELFKKNGCTPLNFLHAGRYEPFCRIVKYLQEHGESDELFRIGKVILEDSITALQPDIECFEKNEEITRLRKLADDTINKGSPEQILSVKADLRQAIISARPGRNIKDHCSIVVSYEHKLLKTWADAAKRQADPKRALKQLGNLIEKLSRNLKRAQSLRPIAEVTLELISLDIKVSRASLAYPGPNPCITSRIIALVKHVVKNCENPTSLDEATVLIRQLGTTETSTFLGVFKTIAAQCDDAFKRYLLTSICLKIWYIVATNTGLACKFCRTEWTGHGCRLCLKEITAIALDSYQSGLEDDSLIQDITSRQSTNPLSDISVIGAMSLLRLAGLGNPRAPHGASSLYNADIPLFMQAVLWLDSCRDLSPYVSTDHSVVLVKLYILMGCVSRARVIWEGFDVKNALLDSLGLLFIDRLSSISPGHFMGSSRSNPVEPFMNHFTREFKTTIPKKIMDSLEEQTYSSIPDIIEYAERHAASCSVVLAMVEERRGARMKANKAEIAIDDRPLVRDLSIEHELQDVTDYKVFSLSNGASDEASNHSIIHSGPLPTGNRAHLGLLAERFLDLVCYVQPKEYKPPKAGRVIQLDWEYALATSSRLEKDMRTLMPTIDSSLSEKEQVEQFRQQELVAKSLTSSELWYHGIVRRLASMVKDIVGSGILKAPTNDSRDRIRSTIEEILRGLEMQTNDFLAVPQSHHSKLHGFHGFAALHAMGMLRETIIVLKHTVNYLTITSEKAKTVDKLRSQAELAWFTPELRKMTAAVAVSEKSVKTRISQLQGYLDNMDGWRDRLCDWVFGKYAIVVDNEKEFKNEVCQKMQAIVPKDNAEKWTDDIGNSWRELIKGWAIVKFD